MTPRHAPESASHAATSPLNTGTVPLIRSLTVACCVLAVSPALQMMSKMMANIAKAPADMKFRKLRLSNPKVAEGLVYVAGARQFLVALGYGHGTRDQRTTAEA